ncbi:7709_t:CDS:1, partial [Funneliformis caledonium]
SQNFVVDTPDGSLDLEVALRFERMNAAEKSTSRTKGRLTRWTNACRKIHSVPLKLAADYLILIFIEKKKILFF